MASSMDATGALKVTAVGGAANVTILNPSVTVDDGGTSLTVDGAVSVSNFPAVQPVSDNGASLTVDGIVAVSNFPTSTGSTDANGRLRTSHSHLVQKMGNSYVLDTPFWSTANTGTGVAPSFSNLTRNISCSCTAGTGTSVAAGMHIVNFDSDASFLCSAMFYISAQATSASSFIGWYDPISTYCQNGFTFEYTSGTAIFNLHFNIGSGTGSVSNIAQVSWNLDTLDGTGPSGYTLDFTKYQTVCFDVQGGHFGRIRCGFMMHGTIVWAHYFDRSNETNFLVWGSNTAPFYVATTSNVSTGTQTIQFRESNVVKEGVPRYPRSLIAATNTSSITVSTVAWANLLSFRAKTTLNSIPPRKMFRPLRMQIDNLTNAIQVVIVYGTVFSVAPTYAAVDAGVATRSGFEVGTGGTISSIMGAGGIQAFVRYVAAGANIDVDLAPIFDPVSDVPITLQHTGTTRSLNTMTVAALSIGAGNATTRCFFSFEELE